MCGILGVFRPGTSPLAPEKLQRLTAILDHRGPDNSGTAALHNATFGHTRLSILGLNAPLSNQPVNTNNCLLSFNGEIYNFHTLRQNLLMEGVACGETSDTETLFHCLRLWGIEKTLSQLDGMYAFAFYDGNKRTLYLARDRMGEKPLYWSQTSGQFWFGSEIKSLLASGEVSSAPNLARIDDFFCTGAVNGNQTIFRDIHELPPGSFLTIEEAAPSPRLTEYWRLEDCGIELPPQSMDTWAREFLGRLDEAIASRQISDVPIGILLSGGIDSNTIAERIMESAAQSPAFFFAESSDPATSERKDVDAFLNFQKERRPDFNIELHTATLDFKSFLKEHIRQTWHFDEPVFFNNSIALSAISRKASQLGFKVLLSGEGSDEILFGYDRFSRTLESLGSAPEKEQILRTLYLGGGEQNAALVNKLCHGHAEGIRQTEPWQWLDKNIDIFPLSRLQMLFSQKFRLLTLLQRQDRVCMSHGIEARIPFLAPDLVRWVNRLPFSTKYDAKSRRTKHVLRHAMAHKLPQRILTKPKDGFPSGVESWIFSGPLKPILKSLVFDPDGFISSYLDRSLAQKILEDYFAGKKQYEFLAWRFFNLEIWHRLYRDGIHPENWSDSINRVSRDLHPLAA